MAVIHIYSKHARIIFWAFLIFISYKFLTPSPDTGIDFPHLDKIAHFGIFGLLTVLIHYSYKLSNKMQMVIWSLYGLAIEFLQSLTPERSAELLDFVADMLGVIVALMALTKFQNFVAKKD